MGLVGGINPLIINGLYSHDPRVFACVCLWVVGLGFGSGLWVVVFVVVCWFLAMDSKLVKKTLGFLLTADMY